MSRISRPRSQMKMNKTTPLDLTETLPSVDELIDRTSLSRFQIGTIVLCGLVLLLDGFDTQSIGFLVPPISASLHIPLRAFGPVLVAGLVGLMLASMASGPIADRWGRRWAVIGSTLAFGVFSIFTARSTSLNELVLFRFLTGLGLGGAMPNVVALASEYAPKRLQAVLVSMIFSGMGLGALVAGIAGSFMLPVWGWRSVLYLGGGLPIALAFILIAALPESIRFLMLRGIDPKRVATLARRMGLSDQQATTPVRKTSDNLSERLAVVNLFTEGRSTGTLLLWVPFFMNLLILYFILSWLPALLRQAGLPQQAGITGVSLFSLGGVIGSLLEGRWMNRFGASKLMLTEFIVSLLLIVLLAFLFASYPIMMAVTFTLGVSVQGAQAGLNALAAIFYPTSIRSTGIGWCSGIGRIGSIIGPLIGGVLLSLAWTPRQIFLSGVVPALCSAMVVFLSVRLRITSPYGLEFRIR
jgi:AAHS family 4-hydroxybenzoate transporter-like MFS transporter